MPSNLDRYTYENHVAKPHSEKVVLAHLEPKERIIKWTLHAGNIYKRQLSFYAINLVEDKNALNQVQSLVDIDEPLKWFFDENTKIIYYWSSNGSNPENFFMLVTLRLFFANAPVNLPMDLENGRVVEYEPIIKTISPFNSALDEDNTGVALEGKGRVSFHNVHGWFNDIFDVLFWENNDARVYSWNRDLTPDKSVLLFYGRMKNKQFKDKTVNFELKDFVEILREPLGLPLFSESDGDISESWQGKAKRRVYGRVSGLKVVPTDSVLDGFGLTGLYSILGGTNLVIGNENTKPIDEITPGDDIFIDGEQTKVKKVFINSFELVETIPQTYTNISIKCNPEIAYRGRNRQHLIAHHALREPTTNVVRGLSENIIEVVSTTDFENDDFVTIGVELKQIKRIVKNLFTLYTNLSEIPQPGTTVIKKPIYSVHFEKQKLIPSDFEIENLETGSKLLINELAEFNLTKPKNLIGTLTFQEDKNVVTTSKIELSGQSKFSTNSEIVKSDSTTINGGSVFTNNSRYVAPGNISIDGELQFINGSNVVTTKKTDIDGKLKFTKDSKKVYSDAAKINGKLTFTNLDATVENKGSELTGNLSFKNNSVKVKTQSTELTGKMEFVNGSNIVRAESKSVSGKANWVNGSNVLNMVVGAIAGVSITFENGNNSVFGVGTTFIDDVSDGDYLRPPGTTKTYKVDSVINNTEIVLVGSFQEATTSNPTAELIASSDLTAFNTDLAINDWVQVYGAGVYDWQQVQAINSFEQLILTAPFNAPSVAESIEGAHYTKFNTEIAFGDYVKLKTGKEYYKVSHVQDEREIRLELNYPESNGSGSSEVAKSYHLTAFKTEIVNGQYIKPTINGKWYRVGEVISNFELNLDNIFQESNYIGVSQVTSYPSNFTTQLTVGQVIRVPGGNWYEIDNIINDSMLDLVSNFLEQSVVSFADFATAPARFTEQVNIGDYIRPDNDGFGWYKVKKVDSNEEITLESKFKTTIEEFGHVTNTPTFFDSSTATDKIIVGDFIKPDSGGSYFEVATIINDYKLTLAINFSEANQSGTSNKATNPTTYLSDVSVNEWIKPNFSGGKYYQVQQIISDTSILLYERFDEPTTPIISVDVIATPTKYIDELATGDKIQLADGSEWYEIKSILDSGSLELTSQFTKTTAIGTVFKQTPGAFLSQLKPRDWIKADNSTTWYEILEIESNNRLLLRELFRQSSVTTTAQRKNVDYIKDDSNIVIETLGKTQSGEKTGALIKTASDVIKDLMIESGLGDKLNLDSFIEANNDSPYLISLALPLKADEKTPKIKTVVEYITETVFGSLYNDKSFNINFSITTTKKPENLTIIDDSDIIKFSIDSKSKKIIRKVIVQYRQQDFDVFGDGSTYKYKTFVSNLIDNLNSTQLTKTIDAFLYHEKDAEVFAQRYVFFHELAKSFVKIKAKLNLSHHSLNDVIMVKFDNMYKRLGSTSDNSKIALVSSISKNGINAELKLDDLSNAFNRIANITSDDSEVFALANENEKRFNGYITDENEMIDNDETTFGINLIG